MGKHIRIASGFAAAAILIGGVASAQTDAFPSQIGVGAQGSEVTSLQTWLENNGYYSGPVTGYYGSLTMAAVEQYQTAHGISDTGYVGPLTLAALNSQASGSTSTGANASELAQLQSELQSLLAQIQALEIGMTVTTTSATPTGSATTLSTNENTSVGATLSASGTGPFTYTITSYPHNGTVTSFNSSTGAFTYMPSSNYTGRDSFTYTVGNSSGVSAPTAITINVIASSTSATSTSANTPTTQNLSLTTSNGAAINATLGASGAGPFLFQIATNPTYGTISNLSSSTGSFTYIPTNSTYTGNDSFTYVVGNSSGTSSPATVTISD